MQRFQVLGICVNKDVQNQNIQHSSICRQNFKPQSSDSKHWDAVRGLCCTAPVPPQTWCCWLCHTVTWSSSTGLENSDSAWQCSVCLCRQPLPHLREGLLRKLHGKPREMEDKCRSEVTKLQGCPAAPPFITVNLVPSAATALPHLCQLTVGKKDRPYPY